MSPSSFRRSRSGRAPRVRPTPSGVMVRPVVPPVSGSSAYSFSIRLTAVLGLSGSSSQISRSISSRTRLLIR